MEKGDVAVEENGVSYSFVKLLTRLVFVRSKMWLQLRHYLRLTRFNFNTTSLRFCQWNFKQLTPYIFCLGVRGTTVKKSKHHQCLRYVILTNAHIVSKKMKSTR